MRTQRYIPFAVLVCIITTLTCTRRPLDIETSGVRIDLLNNYMMPFISSKGKPYHYEVMLYDHFSGDYVTEDFVPETGGIIDAESGRYDVVTYDLDNSNTLFDGRGRISSFRAYTEEADQIDRLRFLNCRMAFITKAQQDGIKILEEVGAAGYEDEKVIREPNALYAGRTNDVNIPIRSMSEETFVIPVENRSVLSQGRLTFYGIKNTENILNVQVFITNLSSSKYIYTDTPDNVPTTIGFYMRHIGNDYLQGEFNYFGKITDRYMVNTAYVIITDLANFKYIFVVDVTNQISEQKDNADLVLNLDFSIPEPTAGGSGFDPVVGEWDNVWYDLPLGKPTG